MLAGTVAGVLLLAATSPADDARSALRAMLALTPSMNWNTSGNRPCIRPDTTPQHVRLRLGRRGLSANPSPWYRDSVPEGARGERVPPAEEARIQAAERLAWSVPAEPRSVERIEANWRPEGFPFCTGTGYEAPLEYSAPVIIGDLAFVTIDYQCPLCGGGTLFALKRRATGWALLAWSGQWVS